MCIRDRLCLTSSWQMPHSSEGGSVHFQPRRFTVLKWFEDVCVHVLVYSTEWTGLCGYSNVVHTSSSFHPHMRPHVHAHTQTHTHTHTHSHTIWGPQTDRAKSGHRPKDNEEAVNLKDLHSVMLGSDVRTIYWCICLSHAWNPPCGRPSRVWHFVSTPRQNVNSEAGLCFVLLCACM